jgi:hypothetical protein
VALTDEALRQVWNRLFGPGTTPDRKFELCVGAAFDHEILGKEYEGIHKWVFRRANAFNIAANSFCGLVLSFPFGHWVIGIPWRFAWWGPVAAFAILLVFAARWAWHDTMDMLEFMAKMVESQPRPSRSMTSG